MLLDNPPDNPCFGCGPGLARGLRLNFRRERAADGADEVVTEHVPRPDEIGWPTLMHTGLHFTVLYEVSYWGAWELSGQVQNSFGPATYDQRRLPRVGAPFRAAARLLGPVEGGLRMRATSSTLEGKPLATLETTWRPASRAATEKAGIALPDYLLREMAP